MTRAYELSDNLRGIRVIAALNGLELFGHERGNIEVFRALREQGADVLVGVNAIENGGAVGQHLRALGFETFLIPFGNQWSWQWLKRYPLSVFTKIREVVASSLVFRKAMRQFNPTHIHLGSPLVYSYISIALILCRTPLVYRMGDAPPLDSPFNLRIWSMAMRRTTHLVSISEFVRRMALQAGTNNSKVIYNLAPTGIAVDRVASPLECMDERIRVLYVGAVAEHKGLIPLLETIAQLVTEFPTLKLDVVGGSRFDTPFRTRLGALVSSLQIEDRVTFHGHIDDPSSFYRAAAVLVAPSTWEEPLGSVVMEAKLASTPSVVFPSGGLPEMINHQVDGYVCYDKSTAALVEALRWMLADTGRLRRMGDAARADFVARFGPERFACEWAEVYRSAEGVQL